ncbi:MAG: metal-dependent hydrolase [candidate division Zixibacteria bacterium]|nr:metal-dependent hydrolase [candidate division Zixibacteria bacterium]
MENLAHTCVGYVLARTGLGRWTPLGTAALVVGANLPDIDVLYTAFGDHAVYLEHHRGISHAVVGLAGLSVLQVGVLRPFQRRVARNGSAGTISFFRLMILSLIGVSSHFLLYFTNSYGIRPFLPFDDRWIYGDCVFIVDPWIWLILGGPCIWFAVRRRWLTALYIAVALTATALIFMFRDGALPLTAKAVWVTGLAAIVWVRLGYRERWTPNIATGALITLSAYWAGLAVLHEIAVRRVETRAEVRALSEPIRRMGVLPTPVDPFCWVVIVETDRLTLTGEIKLYETPEQTTPFLSRPRHMEREEVKTALATPQGQTLLRFARFLVADPPEETEAFPWCYATFDLDRRAYAGLALSPCRQYRCADQAHRRRRVLPSLG